MAILNNNTLPGSSGQGDSSYTIDNSLRFRKSASTSLRRTFGTATDRNVWTYSAWVKRGTLGVVRDTLFSAHTANNDAGYVSIGFNSDDTLQVSSWSLQRFRSNQVFRDVSAWYHIVITADTTNATATDRLIVYVNGERITAANYTAYGLNSNIGPINSATQHTFFSDDYSTGRWYYDGYGTEVNFVDGQALDPTYFGETDEDTGAWIPKAYEGTYGNNGFYLKGRGTDNSGNGNNFTETNFNTTNSALTTYDIMTDVPTLTNENTANFATLNPLDNNGVALTEGNLTGVIAINENVSATIAPTSGKWYWEVYVVDNTNPYIGIKKTESNTTGYTGEAVGINTAGDIYFNASNQSKDGLPGFSNTDIVGVAWDADAQLVWWSKNGQWYTADAAGESAIASSEVAAGNNGYDYSSQITNAKPYVGSSASNGSVTLNFGQRPFAYTPPTGFKKLNTFNLPDSAIEDGSTNFNTVLYTGTGGASQPITGVGFQPNLVWIKNRSSANSNNLIDSVRGATKHMFSNTTDQEYTYANGLTSFNSDGFTVGNLADVGGVNTYVAWNWKAGGTAVSNTDGTITSQVSANPTAGFSIVTFTDDGVAGKTIGHGLGQKPSILIQKPRGTGHWYTFFDFIDGSYDYLLLNTTGAKLNSTLAPATDTVFSNLQIAGNSVAYCFANVEGYSKIGTYTGNGSADGAFVYTGFKPKMVIIKTTSAAFAWVILDTERNPENLVHDVLYPSLSNAEANATTYASFDAVSNGFKLRNTHQYTNYNNYNYLYMAFAENPFKNSTAR